MHSWTEIVELIASGELQLLKRTQKTTEAYHSYKQALALRGTTVVDLVVNDKLCWDRQELAKLAVKYPDAQTQAHVLLTDRALFSLLPNDFPYDFPATVHHLVLWSKIQIPLYRENSREMVPEVRETIEQFLASNLAGYDLQGYAWFVNYPYLQSIKAISHIHVLLNTNDSPSIDAMLSRGFWPIGAGGKA
ncbi:LANO_0E09076g1_1 [Lachancea nothofagi CBS 11611]|uniref:LANO_0E09076g1_1 n=1 Tax=Lachancea nothofagi CBS 11611 TaxID=1266666 RepID=A0A1G4JVI3_9SACH|nr:LANO_0E09076g1_1 [Lachancea nothofagi CBS 11611]